MGSQKQETDDAASAKLPRERGVRSFLDVSSDHFKAECKRLNTLEPIREFRALLGITHSILEQLNSKYGFDAARDLLSAEYHHARREAWDAWREIWTSLRTDLDRDRRMHSLLHDKAARVRAEAVAANARKLAAENSDPKFAEVNEAMLSAAEVLLVAARPAPATRIWFLPSLLFLWIRLSAFRVFVTYGLARTAFLILRHTRVMVFMVLGTGLAFGVLSQFGGEVVKELSPPRWWWATGLFAFAAAMFKQYWLSDRVKKYLKQWETRRLMALAVQLSNLRIMALVYRTSRREPLAGTQA